MGTWRLRRRAPPDPSGRCGSMEVYGAIHVSGRDSSMVQSVHFSKADRVIIFFAAFRMYF
jgi:hypothetical protein